MQRIRVLGGLSAALFGAAALSSSCHQEEKPAPTTDKTVLDGMQLSAARRVGLESAVDALQRGDLQRLEMLRTWSLGRAQVALFSEEDLASLDLGIACLDGSLAPSDRPAAAKQLRAGQLRQPARGLCLPDDE